jgi:hypothetical protein
VYYQSFGTKENKLLDRQPGEVAELSGRFEAGDGRVDFMPGFQAPAFSP